METRWSLCRHNVGDHPAPKKWAPQVVEGVEDLEEMRERQEESICG